MNISKECMREKEGKGTKTGNVQERQEYIQEMNGCCQTR